MRVSAGPGILCPLVTSSSHISPPAGPVMFALCKSRHELLTYEAKGNEVIGIQWGHFDGRWSNCLMERRRN